MYRHMMGSHGKYTFATWLKIIFIFDYLKNQLYFVNLNFIQLRVLGRDLIMATHVPFN